MVLTWITANLGKCIYCSFSEADEYVPADNYTKSFDFNKMYHNFIKLMIYKELNKTDERQKSL